MTDTAPAPASTDTDVSAVHEALNQVEKLIAPVASKVPERFQRLHNFLSTAHQEVDAIATAVDRLANP